MKALARALEQIGLTNSDIEKHLKRGAQLTDLESFIDCMDGCMLDWEDTTGLSKEKFIEKFDSAEHDEIGFFGDTDLVILDGEKFLIEYCL